MLFLHFITTSAFSIEFLYSLDFENVRPVMFYLEEYVHFLIIECLCLTSWFEDIFVLLYAKNKMAVSLLTPRGNRG